jgi:hypothetical protein
MVTDSQVQVHVPNSRGNILSVQPYVYIARSLQLPYHPIDNPFYINIDMNCQHRVPKSSWTYWVNNFFSSSC